jgi:hypothetical protein
MIRHPGPGYLTLSEPDTAPSGVERIVGSASYNSWMKRSFTLDNAATMHVCNMRDRFVSFSEAVGNCKTGDGHTQFFCKGMVELRMKAPNGRDTVTINLADRPLFARIPYQYRLFAPSHRQRPVLEP